MVPDQDHTSKLYQEIILHVRDVRKKQQKVALLNGLLVTTCISFFLIVDAIILERAFSLSTIGRTILFSLFVVGISSCAAWYLGRPFLRMVNILPSSSDSDIALLIGQHFPHIRDRLLNALQLFETQHRSPVLYSSGLIDAAFADLYNAVKPLDFFEAVDVNPLRRMRKFTAYAASVCLLLFVLSPSGFLDSAHRILWFNQTFAAPAPIRFVVEPGNIEVVRGATVPLTIHTQGKPVSGIFLKMRRQGELEFESRDLRSEEPSGYEGVFHDSIANIKSTTEYFTEVEDISSEKFRIAVVDRPLIRSFRVQLHYPSYTRLSPKMLDENIGDVSSYKGTLISVEIVSSKQLSSASLAFNDKSELAMSVDESNARVKFPLQAEKTYHVVLN